MLNESSFTKPTDICPNPEWWHTEDGMSTETEVSLFIGAFVRAVQPEFVLEVGAGSGATTHRIATVMANNKHGLFVSLEKDPVMVARVKERCKGLPVEILVMDSLKYEPPLPINFLFVDGSPNRLKDVRHFNPYLAPGAFVLVHDTANRPYAGMVPDILGCLHGSPIQLDTPRGLLIVKV